MSFAKMKRKQQQLKQQAEAEQAQHELNNLPWDKIREYPIVLCHTLKGPVMGYLTGRSESYFRLYAPAHVSIIPPSNVVWMPIAFVEKYIDLRQDALFGLSDAPEVIIAGYKGYFEEFIKGNYRTKPVVAPAQMPVGEAHEVVLPPTEPTAVEVVQNEPPRDVVEQ